MSHAEEAKTDRDRLGDPEFGPLPSKDLDRRSLRLRRLFLSLTVLMLGFGLFVFERALNLLLIGHHLPPGVSLTEPLNGGGVLWQRLLRVGAYRKYGAIFDASGKQIFIIRTINSGTYDPSENGKRQREAMRKEREDLEERFIVISLKSISLP